MRAKGTRSDIVRSKLLRHDGQFRMQYFPVTSSAQESISSDRPPTTSEHGAVSQLSIILESADWTPARFFKLATGPESSVDQFGILENARCIDIGGLPTTIPPALIGVCLQSTPAAAATDQLHYPDSSRLVRRPGSGSVRAGSPIGCPHCGSGQQTFSAASHRKAAWSAALRRALGSGSGQRREC